MWVTAEVSQEPMGWLKALAMLNMLLMSVTAEVFQEPMGWLKAWASLNFDFARR